MQMQPYENVLYINNGVDAPQVYDPSGGTVTDAGTDYDGDITDDIKSAHLFVRSKSRGVYLNTNEGGSSIQYPQRARCTPVNDIEYAGASATIDYSDLAADAPTEDTIISATFVGDDIIVLFKRSVWRLRYDGDPFAPFSWERIPSMDGAVSRLGVVSLGSLAIWRGGRSMQATDGVSAIPFDFDIPDFTLGWNSDAANYTVGAYLPEERQVLFTYADSGSDYPDSILAIQLNEELQSKSFSIYKTATGMHCFGDWRRSSVLTMDDVYDASDSIAWTFDSPEAGSKGYPILLAGDRDGAIYHYSNGYSDNGSSIIMDVRTADLNPVYSEGYQAHLGHVDIYCDAVEGGVLVVYVYGAESHAPQVWMEVDLSPTGTEKKVRRRVVVNRISDFHSIQIVNDSTLPIAIDEVEPWFKAAGRVRAVGGTYIQSGGGAPPAQSGGGIPPPPWG